MLNVRANDEHFSTALDPKTVCATGMVVLLSGDQGLHIVDAREVLAGLGDLEEFEIGSHLFQLHWEVFRLHLDLKDLPQMANGLIPGKREEGDFLTGIIGRRKEGKALDVVPVKVRERDHDLFLLVPDGEEVAPQISQSRAGVNDGNAVGIGEGDLQAGGVTTELLKTSITDRDGSPRAVKFKFHKVVAGPYHQHRRR